MKHSKRILIIVMLLSLLLSGCSLFSKEDELSVEDQANTSVAMTLEVMQGVETIVAMTMAVERATQAALAASATEAMQAPTSTETQIPSETALPTLAFTATLSAPVVSISVPTNCRTGPGTAYAQISVLLLEQEAEVVARSLDGAYWVIRNPSGSGTCWLWGFYATVEGPTDGLPVWDPPPTPTPMATATPTITPTSILTSTNTPQPTTYSTGAIEIDQTYTADLDEGYANGGTGKDLWFNAVSATEKYLSPVNGASFAVWGTSAPGMYGCLAAGLSTASIPLASAPVGTYVCYKTNEGRPGSFRVNELTGSTLKIGYTTWNAP